MFGEFIIRSTQQFLQSLQPVTEVVQQYTETTTSYSDGAAYSSNFTLQVILLAISLLYLVIRHYDFKQLKIRFHWSVLIWVPVLFTMVGLFGDVVTTLSGEYNYFDPALVPFMNPQEIINKFLALSPMAIAYGLLNGFYEEFFFLGLMTSVKEEHQWKALAFSTLVRSHSIRIKECCGQWLSVSCTDCSTTSCTRKWSKTYYHSSLCTHWQICLVQPSSTC